jgi:hypothetical protein
MSSNRQKVDDDPLSMFMSAGPAPQPEPVSAPSMAPVAPEVVFKRSEPFKSKKQSAGAAASPVAQGSGGQSVPQVSSKNDGALVGAVPITFSAPKPTTSAFPPASSASIKPDPDEDDAPIFGGPVKEAVEPKVLEKRSQNNGGVLRFGNERVNEDKLDDLTVNRLLEKEEDLDFAMFGTSNAIIGGGSKKAVAAAASNPATTAKVLDDGLLNDSIFDLNISDTRGSQLPSSKVSYTSTVSDQLPAAVAGLGSGSEFDINAYIKSQSEDSGGGLFD